MSVVLSKRKESRIEVIRNAEKLQEALYDLSNRDFGVYSRNSLLRRRYNQLTKRGLSEERIDHLITSKSKRIVGLADELLDLLKSADAIFPKPPTDIKIRRSYQDQALATCGSINAELSSITTFFEVDLNVFPTALELLDREFHLIRRWRTSDNTRISKS